MRAFRAMKSGVARSDSVILVKNIPFQVSTMELNDMFGRHGQIGRVRWVYSRRFIEVVCSFRLSFLPLIRWP